MTRYMVEMTHSPSECVEALEEIEPQARDMLGDIYWDCMSGKHTGRVVVEADSEEDVWKMVPASVRNEVEVKQVETVSPELAEGPVIDPEAVSLDPEASDTEAS